MTVSTATRHAILQATREAFRLGAASTREATSKVAQMQTAAESYATSLIEAHIRDDIERAVAPEGTS